MESPGPFLPPNCLVASTILEVVHTLEEGLRINPGPNNVPPSHLFVPEAVLPQVLDWAQSSLLACHPGVTHNLPLLSRLLWCPAMRQDTMVFVAACVPCACSNTSNACPSGLPRPQVIPRHPWSHIAQDFIPGLPPSDSTTFFFTVIDRFSKCAHFVPLPQLPTAKETAEFIILPIFRLHWLPLKTSAFYSLIVAKPYLSPGFHPKTNGQTKCLNQDLGGGLLCMVEQFLLAGPIPRPR